MILIIAGLPLGSLWGLSPSDQAPTDGLTLRIERVQSNFQSRSFSTLLRV